MIASRTSSITKSIKRLLGIPLALLVFTHATWAAPVQIIGFEQGDTGECRSLTAGSGTDATAAAARSGGYGYVSDSLGSGTSTPNCRVGIPGTTGLPTGEINQATTYSRFYINIQTLPGSSEEEFAAIVNTSGAAKAQYRVTSGGNVKACDSTATCGSAGSTTLSTSTWYRIEIQTSTGAGSTAYEIKINGTSELSGTMSQGTVNVGSLRLGKSTNRNSQQIKYYFDDVLIDSAAYPGPGAVLKMSPNANGSTAEWTAGTGSSDYQEVDEIPTDGDTTYIQKSSAASQTHLVGLESSASAGINNTINAVKSFQRCRESAGGVTSATLARIRSGGTNSDSSTLNGSTSFQNQYRVLDTDPSDAGAWTTGDLDAVEIGASDTAATSSVRCSTMLMSVDVVATNTPTPTPTNTPTHTPTPTPTPTPTNTPVAGALRLLPATGVGQ